MERWETIVLGRRGNGALSGTFRATGATRLTEIEFAVVASGRLAHDTEPPNGYLQATGRGMPWDVFTLTFSEPIVKSELEAVEATLPGGLASVPLLGTVLPTVDTVSGKVDTVFASAQKAEFRLPVELSWAGIWHTDVVLIPDGTTRELAFEVWMDCPEGASLTWAVDSIGVTE